MHLLKIYKLLPIGTADFTRRVWCEADHLSRNFKGEWAKHCTSDAMHCATCACFERHGQIHNHARCCTVTGIESLVSAVAKGVHTAFSAQTGKL